MIVEFIVWSVFTGSLFAFNCSSPFIKDSEECMISKQAQMIKLESRLTLEEFEEFEEGE